MASRLQCGSCFAAHVLQNPNALDSKVTLDFDHVKNSLKIDDEGIIAALTELPGRISYVFLSPSFTVCFPLISLLQN